MADRWVEAALLAAMALAGVELVRSGVAWQAPAAAGLPAGLQRAPRLEGYRAQPVAGRPPRRERDRSLGQAISWRLVPEDQPPLGLELVAARSRDRSGLNLKALTADSERALQRPRWQTVGPGQAVALGTIGGRAALQTCLVGRGQGEERPRAGGRADASRSELAEASRRWSERVEPAGSRRQQARRWLAVQAGLRLNERWECLLVTMRSEQAGRTAQALVPVWKQLEPQLRSWGESLDPGTRRP